VDADTIDGKPLSPQSRASLRALMQAAGAAQARLLPSQRANPSDVAQSVLDAFKQNNELVNGTWQRKRVVRLSRGLVVKTQAPTS